MSTKYAILAMFLTFVLGFLFGTFPKRKGKTEAAPQSTNYETQDIVIRKGDRNPITLRPHQVIYGCTHERVGEFSGSAAEVWMIHYPDGHMVACSEVVP